MTNRLRARAVVAVALLLVVGFVTDIGRLFWLQLVKGEEYKAQAQIQQLRDTTLSAERGVIYDSNMNELAQSASAWLVYINPSKIESDEQGELIASKLSEILDVDIDTVRTKVSHKDYGYEKIKGQVEYADKEKVRKFVSENDLGEIVGIDPDTKRYYPYSDFASTVLGFTGNDDTGRSGLELTYNDTLTGVAGRVIAAKNAQSQEMPSGYETTYEAQDGTSLVLTLDSTIQYALEKGLAQAVIDNDAKSAYGIVMDVDTGAVLAMSTKPDYDLNDPYTITDKNALAEVEEIKKQLAEDDDPDNDDTAYNDVLYSLWRNRAISDTYEPGSVFKVITLSSALDEGAITPSFTYTCGGSIRVAGNTIRCHNTSGHGTENVTEGLVNSCNPFFITVGQKLGSKNFYKYFEAFGLTDKTGIDLPGEAKPVAGVTYYTGANLGISELSSCAFGQSFQVSAIQMITAVSAIANGGHLMTPYLVKSMLDEDGNVVYTAQPKEKRQVISETTSKTVVSMMEEVVKRGTGKNAYIAGYRVAGKTGTSEKLTEENQYIASFVGFAPANDPKIAVLIVIDEPQNYVHSGGAIAAPVASEVLEQSLRYLNVEPVYTDEELAELSASVPNVTGMTVASARTALKNQGFSARVIGSGDSVLYQSPSGEQTLPKNGVVVLYTQKGVTSATGTVPDLTGLSISEANTKAVNAGFNIRISGSSLDGQVVSYRQSVEKSTEAELGTIITVYFKTTTGVQDF